MLQGVPTNYPNGVSNADVGSFGSTVPLPWPPQYYTWFQDFDYFLGSAAATNAADWLLTLTGTGTVVVNDTFGGILQATNSAADNDAIFAQWQGNNNPNNVAATVALDATKSTWFGCKFALSDITQTDFICGLAVTDTTPLDAADCLYFSKADDSTTLQLIHRVGGVATSVSLGVTLVNAAFTEIGFSNDPLTNKWTAYQNVGAALGGWTAVGSITPATLTTAALAYSFGVQNGDAVARNLQLDYMFFCRER